MRLLLWLALAAALYPADLPPLAGLPPVEALAIGPQGGLFATVPTHGGLVIQIFGSGAWKALCRTGGRPRGLAFDGSGDLYVADEGLGQVLRVKPWGEVSEVPGRPAPEAARSVNGGTGLRTLFRIGSKPGTIDLVRLPEPAPDARPRLAIVSPPDGAILNRHDGERTAEGLRITVRAAAPRGSAVTVNGAPCDFSGEECVAWITLTAAENRIVARAGGERAEAIVLWDKHSYPRYRFSTDDNIWFLRDIARNAGRYKSIFDNPYMAMWRELHRKYGTKFHHNLYYESEGFNLSGMPDKFREEWKANSGWMRLSFHALANDPDRPYVHASAAQILRDYRLVMKEIERFAGREVLSPVTTVHWGEATLEAVRALRREGVRTLAGYFEFRNGLPAVSYYLPLARLQYMMGRDYWKDTREDITFVRHDIVINSVPLDRIEDRLERVTADPHQSEILELMIHEQYFYPDYRAYEPDYRQRVERAIEWVTKRGYRPVFYGDGFLGAEAR